MPAERPAPVVVRTISDEATWDRLAPDWAELFASSAQAATPLRFSWLRQWWRIYGPSNGAGGLRILTCWRDGKLVGALPLYEGRLNGYPLGPRRIGFLSTGEAEFEESDPDYLNLLAAPGEESACLGALVPCVREMRWDFLELIDVPGESPLLAIRAWGGDRDDVLIEARGSCAIANLDGGFEAYLQRLSANGRQHARRLIREGDKNGAHFEIVSGPGRRAAFDDLVRLHQARWQAEGKPGCFAAARFTEFHRALVDELAQDDAALLARLSLAGQAIAVVYGFVTAGKFDFYQSGVRMDEQGPLRSPGNLAHLLLMRELSARGVVRYDFLRGASSYKERLATEKRRLFTVRAWRPTPRSIGYRSARFLARAAKRALRQLAARRRSRQPVEGAG